MSNPLRVLVLEDNEADAELMLHELRAAGYEPIWERVEDEQGYLAALSSDWDVILANYRQPDFDALLALKLLREKEVDVPVIVVTAALGDEEAAECIKAGATDYLLKHRMARLGSAVARAIEMKRARGEERLAARRLSDSYESYRTVMESVSESVYILNASGSIVLCNSSFASRLGRSADDVIGTMISEYLPPEAAAIAMQENLVVLKEGVASESEIEYRGPMGKRIHREVRTPLRNGKREIVGVVNVSRDITERKRVEDDLRFWRQDWEEVFQSISDPTVVVNAEHCVVSANRSLLRSLGKSGAEELVGKDCCTLLVGADRPEDNRALEEALASTVQVTVEVRLPPLGGTFVVSCTPIGSEARGSARIIVSCRDVTEKESLNRLSETLHATIQAMAVMVERKDPYTAGHQRRVANLAAAIATEMGLPREQVHNIELAGAIHDVGKISVPAEILCKPGALNGIEFQLIRAHPEAAREILGTIALPWPITEIVLQHHERLDGSGYPFGLTSKEITLEAKVVAVADTIEAMASHRPYRPARTMLEALEELIRGRGKIFDATVVDACIKLLTKAGPQSIGVWFGNRPVPKRFASSSRRQALGRGD